MPAAQRRADLGGRQRLGKRAALHAEFTPAYRIGARTPRHRQVRTASQRFESLARRTPRVVARAQWPRRWRFLALEECRQVAEPQALAAALYDGLEHAGRDDAVQFLLASEAEP